MDKVENLISIKNENIQGGGQEKVNIQHNLGKMTARERILQVLDEGSFIEIGNLIEKNGAGVITGYGTINGRLVYLYSQDYTVNGGLINKTNSNKICRIMKMAQKMGAPLIQIMDSVGAKISDGLDALEAYGKIINLNTSLSGVVPQIAVIVGPCEGIAALSATMSDFTIVVDKCGSLCINSSQKLIEKEEKYVDKNTYSNAENVNRNGNVQLEVKTEDEAFSLIKKLMSYIPSNNLEVSVCESEPVDLNIPKSRLDEIAKTESYDIYEIINEISDEKSLIEINSKWQKAIITGLIKVNGISVGIIATNKNVEKGCLNIKNIDKISRFIKMCDAFNIPILSMVDTKGFEVSLEEEKNGLAVFASKIVYSLSEAEVPKIALIIGEAYGAGYITLASKETSFDITYAWPSAKISLIEPREMAKKLYEKDIISSDNPREKEEKLIDSHIDEFTSPYLAAEKGHVDDIIIPSETKQRLFAMFDMLQSKREIKYPKKHGSILI
ncbi:acyl-CoA carboxylase subunit beta [Haloimpatiens sp. FM7330]|uniref:acyl-CoA carboxylase subunit beta n=1 Tax=Haloimpatiens sp. FM7330 TaxID=3298610 RepID=UPI003630286C